jgi:hypothetical protein
MSGGTKTSFTIDPELLRRFSKYVFNAHGNRKQSEQLEIAIKEYLEKRE